MFSELKNLNNTWVITSRHNGNIFFIRRGYVTRVKNYPNNDCLYYEKDKAMEALAKYNEGRKKCKFTIENASKYFVNSFDTSSYSRRKVTNKAVSIKDIQTNKKVIKDSSKLKETFLSSINRDITYAKNSIEERQKELKNLKQELESIEKIDFEAELKPYETQGDKLVKVLFSTKEKPVDDNF